MRTLAAIFVIALQAGLAAFAATQSGTDAKTPSKATTAKKTTTAKSKSTVASANTKMGIKSTTAKTGTKTGVSNPKQAASKTGTSSRTNGKQQASTRYRRSNQQMPAPDRYREIQQALLDKGYFAGPVDGTWGASSLDALKRFQHDQSLTEDGKLGSLSIIALGLGPKRGGISPLASPAHQPDPALVAPESTPASTPDPK